VKLKSTSARPVIPEKWRSGSARFEVSIAIDRSHKGPTKIYGEGLRYILQAGKNGHYDELDKRVKFTFYRAIICSS
jgi:hypothetical protein